MPERLHLLCAVPVASWIGGIVSSRYAGGGTVGTFGYVLLLSAGLVAAPVLGVWTMRAIPDLFEWESSGPRDFFVPALATASLASFCLAMLASLAFA